MARRIDADRIIRELPGYNMTSYKAKPMFNRDFTRIQKSQSDRIREQDARGGGLFWMLVALLIGGLVMLVIK